MDVMAASALPVTSRPDADASGLSAARTAHLAPGTAPAQTGVAAGPDTRAVFELEEDESTALVGVAESRAAAEPNVSKPAVPESMPIWVIPLLVTAVGELTLSLASPPQRRRDALSVAALLGGGGRAQLMCSHVCNCRCCTK